MRRAASAVFALALLGMTSAPSGNDQIVVIADGHAIRVSQVYRQIASVPDAVSGSLGLDRLAEHMLFEAQYPHASAVAATEIMKAWENAVIRVRYASSAKDACVSYAHVTVDPRLNALAVVNGHVIDFDWLASDPVGRRVLQMALKSLVNRVLLDDYAARHHLTVPSWAVNDQAKYLAIMYAYPDGLGQQDRRDIARRLADIAAAQQYAHVPAADDQRIAQYVLSHPSDFERPPMAQVRRFYVTSAGDAWHVRDLLQSGRLSFKAAQLQYMKPAFCMASLYEGVWESASDEPHGSEQRMFVQYAKLGLISLPIREVHPYGTQFLLVQVVSRMPAATVPLDVAHAYAASVLDGKAVEPFMKRFLASLEKHGGVRVVDHRIQDLPYSQ